MGPWGLAPGQAGLLVFSGLVGFLFGAAVHGLVADRYGRRVTLLAGLWITSVFTLADADCSACLLELLPSAFIDRPRPRRAAAARRRPTSTSSRLGGSATRSRSGAWRWAGPLGGTFAGIVGVFLTPITVGRSSTAIGALSIPLTFVLHFILPEIGKFLAARGRTGRDHEPLVSAPSGPRRRSMRSARLDVQTRKRQKTRSRHCSPQLSTQNADDLDRGVSQPVLHLRPDRLDPHGHDAAGRNLRGKLRLRRAHAGDVFPRRLTCGHWPTGAALSRGCCRHGGRSAGWRSSR